MVASIHAYYIQCEVEGCWHTVTHIVKDKTGAMAGKFCYGHALGLVTLLDDQEVSDMMQSTSVAALFKQDQLALPHGDSPSV